MSKVVIFDLDETLGYFTQLSLLWNSLSYINGYPLNEKDNKLFFKVMDLFPEYLRPNILEILKKVKEKKGIGHCKQCIIYTNNQGDNSWTNLIKMYLESKLDCSLFDKIIRAYKIGGVLVEPLRTSHEKSYADLIRCANLSEETKCFFLDDVYHTPMKHRNVYYITMRPYKYIFSVEEITQRLFKSSFGYPYSAYKKNIVQYLNLFSNKYYNKNRTEEENRIDEKIGKQIMDHLNFFFYLHDDNNNIYMYPHRIYRKTLKKKQLSQKKTKRNRRRIIS